MNNFRHIAITVIVLWQMVLGCSAQTNNNNQRVGGACDGCEIMYIGQPKEINSVDTSAAWGHEGQPLIVTGKVFKVDWRTPASDIVIYYWQTDSRGYYTSKAGLPQGAKQHGYLRGWVKTNNKGEYTIYTIRPAPYPNDNLQAHIHLLIKEPDVNNEYYVDDLNFDDDPLLIPYRKKHPFENRGGSGILRVLLKGGVQIAEHNIVLGLNIPNYPKRGKETQQSGLAIGQDQPSFMPYHAFGPDAGTQTCPVCKYGRYHGIVYFVGNNTNWIEIKLWLVQNTFIIYKHRNIVDKYINLTPTLENFTLIRGVLNKTQGKYFGLQEPAHN